MRIFFLLTYFFLTSLSVCSQHTIVLKEGDKIHGVVLELQNDVLTCMVDGEIKTYHMKEVSSMFFNEYVPYDGSYDPKEPEKTIKSGEYTLKYQMKDRTMIFAPPISNATENRGTVVVEIEIDRYGNVLKAKPGALGSTTTSEYLYAKAQYAAKGAKFNETKVGPVRTTGTISITY